LELLEKWEKEGVSLLLGNDKDLLINKAKSDRDFVDLNQPIGGTKPHPNQYNDLFNF
jgi:hypothetical protein